MNPILNEGIFVFASIADPIKIPSSDIIMLFKEAEGTTLILKKEFADLYQLDYTYLSSWITLGITTSLSMIGLTAKFSSALSNAGISCNVIAAYNHDHIFVDLDRTAEAMHILSDLSF
ncbi:MAG: ACT domain-containing protein [Saprospiraceae bacterium]